MRNHRWALYGLLPLGISLAAGCGSSEKDDTAIPPTDTVDTSETETGDTADPDTAPPPDTGAPESTLASLDTVLNTDGLENATDLFVSTSFNADVALYQLVGAASVYLRGGLYRIGLDLPLGMPIVTSGFEAPECWDVQSVYAPLGPGELEGDGENQYNVELTDCPLNEYSALSLSGNFVLVKTGDVDAG